jgi:hypothetical protein
VIAIRSRMQNPVVQVPQVAVRFPESKEESAPGNTPVAVDRSGRSTEPNGKYGRRGKPGRSARAFVAQTSSNENQTKPSEVVASNVRPEIATEFMPLGYLNAASLQDGGQIVRVEVPRSTMASFGLPVNMDRYNERVKADVLLGVDGVAHAIRFVQ